MAELEYYRSGTAKYTQSAIKQKAPLMYTTNRPERCTQDLMDSMTDSKSGSGQTTAGQTPLYLNPFTFILFETKNTFQIHWPKSDSY